MDDNQHAASTSVPTINPTTHCRSSDVSEHWNILLFTWAGKSFNLEIADSDRVFDLKVALHALTKVPSDRQKILGLVKGKLPPDQSRM